MSGFQQTARAERTADARSGAATGGLYEALNRRPAVQSLLEHQSRLDRSPRVAQLFRMKLKDRDSEDVDVPELLDEDRLAGFLAARDLEPPPAPAPIQAMLIELAARSHQDEVNGPALRSVLAQAINDEEITPGTYPITINGRSINIHSDWLTSLVHVRGYMEYLGLAVPETPRRFAMWNTLALNLDEADPGYASASALIDHLLAGRSSQVGRDAGDYTATPTESLKEAYVGDITGAKTYLQEPEGQLVADLWDVAAEVFDQPNPYRNVIRRTGVTYGEGNAHQGTLLFVGRNHYIVIQPSGAADPAYRDQDGNGYSVLARTVTDGNCLIDGLYIIRNGVHATPEAITEAREYIGGHLEEPQVRDVLTGVIHELLQGVLPQGLGPRTLAILRQDPVLWTAYEDAQRRRAVEDDEESGDLSEEEIGRFTAADFELVKTMSEGSTRPDWVKDKSGRDLLIKRGGKDELHIATEVLANYLYRAAGARIVDTRLIEVDGKKALAREFVLKPEKLDVEDLRKSEAFRKHVAADFLFANWDLVKPDNFMRIEGHDYRIDNGGALSYRAQGQPKEAEDWGPEVRELRTMLESRTKAENPYSGLSVKQIADSIFNLLAKLTPKAIDRAMAAAHYPPDQREPMKETLLARMAFLREFANKVYPVDVVPVEHGDGGGPALEEPSVPDEDLGADESLPFHVRELMRLGYTGIPVEPPPRMAPESVEASGDLPMEVHRFDPDTLPIVPPVINAVEERRGFTPLTRPSHVGPEEYFDEPTFGSRSREKQIPTYRDLFPRDLERMRGGRLLRRMKGAEMEAFKQAAALAKKGFRERNDLIFGKYRGEIVFSVNELYSFEREKEKEDEPAPAPDHSVGYEWVMEIPISDEMMRFLSEFAYTNRPAGQDVPISNQFTVNPQLKYEGQAGGRGGAQGIPNLVVRRPGFEHFWSTVDTLRFIPAAAHVSNEEDPEEDLAKVREKSKVIKGRTLKQLEARSKKLTAGGEEFDPKKLLAALKKPPRKGD